jgi:anti-anti-sigma regulatory factor
MPFSIVNKAGRQTLTLEGAVTVRHAQELAAQLGQKLEESRALVVAAAGLADIDTCILQLLCSLRKTVPALSFENPSEAFLGAVDRCGLKRELLGGQEDM